MDLLYEAACSYQSLLGKDYHVVAGYRGERIEFTFVFLPEHFYHLVGFHKLLDLRGVSRPNMLYRKALAHEIDFSLVAKSPFYGEMSERLRIFSRIQEIIEGLPSGKIVIEFSQKHRTRIRANFLLFQKDRDSYAHLFLRCGERYCVPCSFFCRGDDKYIANNKKYRVIDFCISEHR